MKVLNRKLGLVWAFLALALFLSGAKAAAQTTLVTLEGTVTDEQGAPLPGATVAARNTGTGYTKSATTKEDGRYIISGLQAGPYECEVTIPGFATEIRKGLTFAVGDRANIDFALKQTAIAEEVVITAQSPMVETTKSEISGVVDRLKIDSLPLLPRDLNTFPLTQGGGAASGMVRSALTRSGTNEYHGRVAFFYRDELFDNVNYFVNHDGYNGPELSEDEYEKAPFSHYNWSGNVGGPIKKDKAHFFLAYEGLSHTEYSTITSPLVEQETVPWDQTNNQVMFKLSYQMSEKNLFSLRYGLDRPILSNQGVGGLFTKTTAYDFKAIAHDFQLNWTNYPSDSTMNELRVLYAYEDYKEHSVYDDNSYFEQRPSGYFGKYPNIPQEIATKRYQVVDNFH